MALFDNETQQSHIRKADTLHYAQCRLFILSYVHKIAVISQAKHGLVIAQKTTVPYRTVCLLSAFLPSLATLWIKPWMYRFIAIIAEPF